MLKLPCIKHTIGDFDDDDDVIEFFQWTTTDWSNLTHHTETVNEYVNIVIEQLHWFIKRGFGTGQPIWDPKFLSQINEKQNMLK